MAQLTNTEGVNMRKFGPARTSYRVKKKPHTHTHTHTKTDFLFFFTAPFNNMRTLKFKAQPTIVFFAAVKSNVRRLLPATDYCRARGNEIVEHSSDNETVLGSSRKLSGAAEHLMYGSENRLSRLSYEF